MEESLSETAVGADPTTEQVTMIDTSSTPKKDTVPEHN